MKKKKHFWAIVFMFAILFMLSSCDINDIFSSFNTTINSQTSDTDDKTDIDDENKDNTETEKITINFYNLDRKLIHSETIKKGGTFSVPTVSFYGYEILDWYPEDNPSEFDSDKKTLESIDLYPKVKRIMKEFSLTDEELKLKPNTSKSLKPIIYPEDFGPNAVDYSKVIISSSDESVAKVRYNKDSNEAFITGVNVGTATINFEFENNVKTYDVLVEPNHYLSKFEISEISEISYGDMFYIQTIKTPIDSDDELYLEVEWKSLDEKILTVDNGLIKAVGIGTTTIIAKCDGFTVEREITVVPMLEFKQETYVVKMNNDLDKILNVRVPENYKEEVVLESSDENIATIENGVIKALMPGNVTITAKLGGTTKKCNLIVTLLDFSWSIEGNKQKKLAEGSFVPLEVKTNPESYTGEVKWESTNEDVAFVSGNGIFAYHPGTTTITATCGNLTYKSIVSVYKNINDLSVDNVPNKLGVNCAVQLKITKNPANDQQKVEYSTSNYDVLSVTKDGRLTGKRAGKADLIVICANITKTYTINVLDGLFVDAINKDEYIEYDYIGKSREECLKLTNDKIYGDLLGMYEYNADKIEKGSINTAYNTLNIITLKFISGNDTITKEAKFYIKTKNDLSATIVKQNDEQKIYYVDGKLTIDIFVYGYSDQKTRNNLRVSLYNYNDELVAVKSIPVDIDVNEKKRYTITFDSYTSKNIIPGRSISNYYISYFDYS